MESRAVACDFQQCGIPTCADPDELHSPPPPPPRLRTQTTPRQQPNSHITLKRLIRLRACAGWSKALLVAHTPPSEIACTGSDNIYRQSSRKRRITRIGTHVFSLGRMNFARRESRVRMFLKSARAKNPVAER